MMLKPEPPMVLDQEFVEDGMRYKVSIEGRSFYVVITETSVSTAYAFENRPEELPIRLVLEKFCSELSKIMERRAKNVQEIGCNT